MKHTIEIDYETTAKAALRSDGSLSFSLTVMVPRGGDLAPVGFTAHDLPKEIEAKLRADLDEATKALIEPTLAKALKAAAA